ncbi:MULTISPECIES: carboxypeptidase M32 [unclassified Ruegeria]|uniref:carboxypeptidase M32 n=1 Tax=unclassified Ruegeria TaxID=2625375 RepID=UPI00148956D6|nr:MULTISPECIES: carboxypeptidase M32 [unclassified Ruegeria]NOD34004.1 carboxypeptidase M32 [Ruegeria sp. HKCCD7296]NOD46405.1 carboxypeptidase M32 [Ruegeria sp. HKCCD5849]NOD50295.1 carboxypeptidase M32 [Ruegeria sp. HKCCD5851]NOD67130.1 carboxypeptidase M32 [Ruegeria sp. HKCCD7303]NOE41028.1 carboxypeptidase M32 [Ruegeria sp. HKCCD7319]
MTAFNELMAFQRETSALGQIAGRLGWDQETVMPRGAAPQRAEEMAAIEAVLHARRSDPRVAEWLEQAAPQDEVGKAQLREIRRAYERAVKVPADLATAIARVTSAAQGSWAQARADEDVSAFLPVLEEVVSLKRQEGEALAQGGDVYDAMVEDYEPYTTGTQIAAIFDEMRPRLVALRAAVLDRPEPAALNGSFDERTQMRLTQKLATTFGYDLNNGRVDKAVHPFSSGSGLDVRITTRTSETDPFNCFYSTIHEVGHAAYEQGIDKAYLLTPLGNGVSMGVHESQSRIYENQLGRSRAFTGWLFGQMTEAFGDFGIADAESFYATVNRVHNGYIRTEADEVQYNLHIMLRFDLERALMAGDLQVSELEAAWNDRFKADFGYAVDKPSNGCLQDVHWSVGLFGYFPTYSLGNVYAGCLFQALRAAVPGLDDRLAEGDTSGATGWLREQVQQHGGLYAPRDVIARASGVEPGPEPLLAYLEKKFGALYGL